MRISGLVRQLISWTQNGWKGFRREEVISRWHESDGATKVGGSRSKEGVSTLGLRQREGPAECEFSEAGRSWLWEGWSEPKANGTFTERDADTKVAPGHSERSERSPLRTRLLLDAAPHPEDPLASPQVMSVTRRQCLSRRYSLPSSVPTGN